MIAILLAGGFGTRLRPLTNDTPKQMLPVCGRPMIEWVCEHLRSHGIAGLVLSLGYRADSFTAAYPGGHIAGLPFEVAAEPEPRGTAGAIGFAASHSDVGDTFVVLNGDVLTDLDVTELVGFHETCGAEATIALQAVDDPTPYGLVATDAAGRVVSFSEKPAAPTADAVSAAREQTGHRSARPVVNAGTYVVNRSVLNRIAPADAVSIEREVFPEMAADGTLFACAYDCYWLDTGSPQQYLAANLDVIAGRRRGSRVVDAVAPSASIHADAQVQASVIGARCEIGPDAVVQRSVLGAGCRLARGASVTDSVLGAGVFVAEGARLSGFSVVGTGERIAAGANLSGRCQPAADPD